MTRNSCGWVIRQCTLMRNGREVTSWWYGPDRSWGYSFGPLLDEATRTLSIGVAVFSTRQQAREAMQAVGLKWCTPVLLDQAIDDVWQTAS